MLRPQIALCTAIGWRLVVATSASSQVAILTEFSDSGRSIQRSDIQTYNDALYFSVGVEDSTQRELWRFDGKRASMVSDLFVGNTQSSIDEFVEFKGALYFTADDGVAGTELFRYDGKNVALAADVETGPLGSNPTSLVVHGEQLLFSARNGDSFNNLWSFDGTKATRVSQFANPSASVTLGTSMHGGFYFGADDGATGSELWRYDDNGVQRVADINEGGASSFPRDFVSINDTLYFVAQTDAHGREVWQYDGSDLQLVGDISPDGVWSNPLGLTEMDGDLYFSAVAWRSRYLWRYDGTQLKQLAQGGGPVYDGDEFLVLRGQHEGDVEVQELWETDDEGTRLYRSLTPSAGPFELLHDELYFTCTCNSGELLKVAQNGDADKDGEVTFTDFIMLARMYGQPGNWRDGDFDRNGIVNFSDFLLQSESFGTQPSLGTANLVPEPSSVALLLVGVLLLGRTTRVSSVRPRLSSSN